MADQLSLFQLELTQTVDIEKPHSVCPKCGFKHVRKTLNDTTYCKDCKSKSNKEVRELKKRYPYPEKGSGYCCKVCGRSEEDLKPSYGKHGKLKTVWRLDHDHETKAFRGFLCDNCNVSLGKLNEDPATFIRGAAYLLANSGNAEMSEQELVGRGWNIPTALRWPL